ncbi:MAG: GDP-mannose mannosyl hydrolase [Sulfuricurvum sp.]|nr:GDP-mannose mannosyl hydrolase [Sulfuricurvum sp.]
MLPLDIFKTVVDNTPLIAIDFIIENDEGKYLLGKRVNAPACGYWFTLGGRILKNEKITDAIIRLSQKEFNQEINQKMLTFHGIYEHFYEDSFSDESVSTHYVVLAYRIKIMDSLNLPIFEHHEYNYFSKEELLENSYVHTYVKDYFRGKN